MMFEAGALVGVIAQPICPVSPIVAAMEKAMTKMVANVPTRPPARNASKINITPKLMGTSMLISLMAASANA